MICTHQAHYVFRFSYIKHIPFPPRISFSFVLRITGSDGTPKPLVSFAHGYASDADMYYSNLMNSLAQVGYTVIAYKGTGKSNNPQLIPGRTIPQTLSYMILFYIL